jgi:serine protease Do
VLNNLAELGYHKGVLHGKAGRLFLLVFRALSKLELLFQRWCDWKRTRRNLKNTYQKSVRRTTKMLRFCSTKWGVLLILLVMAAVTIALNMDSFTTQTAVGQAADDDFRYLERANRAFIEVINAAKSSVVQITTTKVVSDRGSQRQFDFFHYWFGEPRNRRDQVVPEEQKREVQGALGSGVIVTEDGYVLTNYHIIDGAEDIEVTLPNGRKYAAEVIGRDSGIEGADVAVLKIEAKGLPALKFGDSDKLQVGEWVVAIGTPFGFAQTVTRGIVSAKGRSLDEINVVVQYADFIQTDAAINRGNSGGALINIHGHLVGINTAIVTGGGFSRGNVGVGFAIPINLAGRIMRALIEKGEVERGWLGVGLQSVDHDIAETHQLGEPRGALVSYVGKGMPGDEAGIQRGDVIVEFNNVRIRDDNHLTNTVAATEVGKTVEVKVIRRGKEKSLRVQLGKRTEEALAAMGGSTPYIFAGLRVTELTDQLAAANGHERENGVLVVDVERGSPAARGGIRRGDLIQEVEWEKITTIAKFREQVKAVAANPKVVLYVRHRNGLPEYVVLKNIESQR